MQIGTRWPAGEPAPARLTAELRQAIKQAEADTGEPGLIWTLTWLEGRPVCELGTVLQVFDTGQKIVVRKLSEPAAFDFETFDETDDWLTN
jgi:hypothetical protein